MSFLLQPLHLFCLMIIGWANKHQQEVIEYLRTENQVLKEKLGKKRILLNDDQRRRLSVKGKVLGRKRHEQIGTLFSPDTILRWHKKLVTKKWDCSNRGKRKSGRPRLPGEAKQLVIRIAKENSCWGYDRIADAVANVGYKISDESVRKILKEQGIEPAPDRKGQTTWSTFLKVHWEVLAAIDFTTVEVWTKGGLVTFYLLFVIELKTRRVHFAGYTTNPHGVWMKQIARNLSDEEDGFLPEKRKLIMGRDSTFGESFREILKQSDIQPIVLPPRSPNLNAFIERFFMLTQN
ncbi:helix-turn-helix domain-containing protein [Gimesia aquarii]|uniref:Integrase core domain protein n=1 Tax=Gimesia aquarii TaxID=2527964 RepID=A0A517VZY3_9PLAN|nr:helix-turn-helix domain-containing protein [Gimesia aquarii]QDT98571.1 Integrase core domain protein [Gimesia aquarii]